jgi:ribosomal-protein-alanine N-acetyltransferase
VFLAAERGGAVAGYVIARRAADEGEILNLAVAPAERGRGLGRVLVQRALAELCAAGARTAFLEVRESNAAALRLYGGLGFEAVARRVRYYRDPEEDALVLRAAIAAGGGDAIL